MPNTCRSFVAFELDAALRQQLKKIQLDLKVSSTDIRWVSTENIHLTLKFLGETPRDRLPLVEEVIKTTFREIKSFPVNLNHLGAFPRLDRPQIIWVGMNTGKSEVIRHAMNLEGQLHPLGFPKESRPFDPHITLGRVKSFKNLSPIAYAVKMYTFKPLEQTLKFITLFKSTLTPQGPIYEKIFSQPLETL